jgi:ribosome-associated heat shock protein Hsp15
MTDRTSQPLAGVRLDIWLDVACLSKTRSEAQRTCKMGRVTVNGVVAKAHRELRVGDTLVISRPLGRKQVIVVRGLADRHLAKVDARALYEDQTPPPTPEEVEMRRAERVFKAVTTPAGRPDKRQRRAIRDTKRTW